MTSHRAPRFVIGTLALAGFALSSTALVVREGEAVLVTRFGRPLRADTGAGLHWKAPWPIDQVTRLDLQLRLLEGGRTEMLTRD